jgi:hypothetical protein
MEKSNLEDICQALSDLSGRLRTWPDTIAPESPGTKFKFSTLLSDLSRSCQDDCIELLAVLEGLTTKHGLSRFSRGIREELSKPILGPKRLLPEGRLERTQRAMSLHIPSFLTCAILSSSPTDRFCRI